MNLGFWTNSDGHYITKSEAGSWDNFFLIGVWSKHWNKEEDRIFKFYYARSKSYSLGNCYSTIPNSGGATLRVPNAMQTLNWGKNRYL